MINNGIVFSCIYGMRNRSSHPRRYFVEGMTPDDSFRILKSERKFRLSPLLLGSSVCCRVILQANWQKLMVQDAARMDWLLPHGFSRFGPRREGGYCI